MVIKSKGSKMKEHLKYAEEQIIDNNTNKDILKHYINQIEHVSIQYGKYLEGGDKMDKEILIKNKAKIKAIVSNECDFYTNSITTTNEVVGDNFIKIIFDGEEYDIKCSLNKENCDELPFYIINARVYKDNLLVKEFHMEIDK